MINPSDAVEKQKPAISRIENEVAAEALRESEHRFRVLAETMPAAIFVYQGDKYVYVNPAAEQITGYSKEELLSMNFWDWASPEYKETLRDRGRARQRGEKVVQRYELRYRAKDGREGWADFAAGLIEYGGKPAVIAVAFDITKRKKAEKALKKSQYILSKAQEISHVGNWAWNLKTGLMNWSDEGFRIFGYMPQEFEPSLDWLLSRVHPDDKDMVARSVDGVRYEYKLGSIDYRIIKPDGSIRYVNTVADKIVRDAEGNPSWVYGINQDITARKQAEKALVKSRAILSRAQDIAHVGNWAWDLKTNSMQWSDEIFKIFGYKPQELQPTYEWLLTRVFPDDRELFTGSASAAVHENKLFNIDYRIITPDGSIHYLNIVADRIKKDKAGDPEWMYGIIQDITGRKQIENELRDAQGQAELYVDLMGHDINNMNMVSLGFLEMAVDKLKSEGMLDTDNEQLLQKASENIKNSSILIDNVRKLKRERAGEYKLKAIDITEIISSVKDQYLNVPNRDVKINLHTTCHCNVIANDLLRDVFSNLVGNAVKHSSGPLAINIDLTYLNEGGLDFCKVAVEDNGPGIPDGLKALIFDRSHTAKKLRGKGLGLYIVNTLVGDFRGKVWVEDRVPGDHAKGAKFVVMLPAIEK
jgi:PAS domain S-box-containing protein